MYSWNINVLVNEKIMKLCCVLNLGLPVEPEIILLLLCPLLALVVQRLDNAIHRIDCYPVDKC